MEIISELLDPLLSFDDTTRHHSFNLTIIDDDSFESVEELTLELRLHPLFPAQPSKVILRPNMSNIIIIDNDGE